jgi:colanic acid/amylovoran biosynthesis glycosyltransferase
MRIAFVVGSFPEISTTFILDQVTGLLDRGHEVEVFARVPRKSAVEHASVKQYGLIERTHYWLDDTKSTLSATLVRTARLVRERKQGVGRAILRSLDLGKNGDLTLTVRMWPYASAMMLEKPYDVVLAHFGPNGVAAQRLREVGAFRAPLVTVFHGYDVSRIVKERGPAYYRDLFAHGDLMLPVSEHFRERLVAYGCAREKLRVHRMGVDTHSFAFRARSRSESEPTRFVTVCRMVEKKGLEFAIRGMAELKAQGTPFVWHVAGDGPLRARIEALRGELGLSEQVVMHGTIPRAEVQALLETAHVFVAPSVTGHDGDQEGVPVAIMEAMAVGLPVISTLHSGIPELVKHGRTGLLVPEHDVTKLAQSLRQVAVEHALWPELGRAGREVVEHEFDEQRLNDQLAALLSEVVERSRS